MFQFMGNPSMKIDIIHYELCGTEDLPNTPKNKNILKYDSRVIFS